jgi:hypothetical protein
MELLASVCAVLAGPTGSGVIVCEDSLSATGSVESATAFDDERFEGRSNSVYWQEGKMDKFKSTRQERGEVLQETLLENPELRYRQQD